MTDADWLALEDALFRLTEAELRSFAASRRHETFYGFAFSCVSEYGDVSLQTNTEDHLDRWARDVAADPRGALLREPVSGEVAERLMQAVGESAFLTPGDVARHSRWEPQSWRYVAFEGDAFRAAWPPFAHAVSEARHREPEDPAASETRTEVEERFLRSVCRVLVRLERERAFDRLNRTADFKGLVRDLRDMEEDARGRLASVRAEFR